MVPSVGASARRCGRTDHRPDGAGTDRRADAPTLTDEYYRGTEMIRFLSAFLPAALVAVVVSPWSQPRPFSAAPPGAAPAPMPRDVKPRGTIEYNRDVRPILAENCFACHGPDSAARKKNLRLDNREDALAAGVIEPGKPERSEVIDRIFADDPKQLMPPAKSHKKLTAAQKETLRKWIAEGAEYQPHWSFIPPVRPQVPDFGGD